MPISKVRFIVAHDTGNPDSTAAQNVRYYTNSCNDMSASAHLFVDDKEILECVPALTAAPEKAWHVLYNVPKDNELYGVNANDAAIGVEYCYGANIDADKAYEKYVWLLARLCDEFELDPSKDIVGHFFLDPQRKTDPVTGLAFSRRTYEGLLRDVAALFATRNGAAETTASFTTIGSKGRATTRVKLNLRNRPDTRGDVAQVLPARTEIVFTATVPDGEPINGNALWYRDAEGRYFWSGGVDIAPETDNSNDSKALIRFDNIDFSNLDLPVTRTQCMDCTGWMKLHFEEQFVKATADTPFVPELLYAIACQETAIYWHRWVQDHTPDEILQHCVFDANGDVNGNRGVFPKNTAAFTAKYGQAFADMLIQEANAMRSWRGWGPKQWVYAGYGIFQYDIQAVLDDEVFFREKQWYDIGQCLDRVIKELNSKWKAHPNDLFQTVKAYNGSGNRAENYARNVFRFLNWIQTSADA